VDVENTLSHLFLSEMVVLKEDSSRVSSRRCHDFIKMNRVEGNLMKDGQDKVEPRDTLTEY
jgi:hypothetical protein